MNNNDQTNSCITTVTEQNTNVLRICECLHAVVEDEWIIFGFQDQLKAHAYLDWDRSWDKTNNKLGSFYIYVYICWYSYSLFNFVLPYHWRLLKNSFKQVWKQNQSNIISFKKAMFDIDKINSINILLKPKTPFVIPQRYTKKPQNTSRTTIRDF
jgi:hypothetical protein